MLLFDISLIHHSFIHLMNTLLCQGLASPTSLQSLHPPGPVSCILINNTAMWLATLARYKGAASAPHFPFLSIPKENILLLSMSAVAALFLVWPSEVAS